jgi:aldehyde:ferredoxin oxidoreductase
MKNVYGWSGQILRIDLTDNVVSHIPTTKYVPKFIGGRGIAAKILWDEVSPEVTAFDPESRLVFMTGPCTGTSSPTSGRMIVAGKAPQTCPVESYARSSIGGYWGPELKFAGYDGVILQGKAETPVYIWIDDNHVEIKKAQNLWGLGAVEVQTKLQEIHGDAVRTMAIGPVGEICSRIAIILTDGGSAAGQGGFGGVMGSKNLKAIVVKGTGSVPVARATELAHGRRHLWKLYYGTREMRENKGKKHDVNRGFDIMQFGPIEKSKLYQEIAAGHIKVTKPQMCYACPVARTGYYIEFLDGTHPPVTAQCEEFTGYINPELDYDGDDKPWGRVAVEWSFLQQNLGINAWETGQVGNAPTRFPDGGGGILWFKDCIQEGLLTDENTGLPVSTFGSRDFVQMQAQMMVEKRGLGKLWVEGVGRMACYIQEHPKEFNLSQKAGNRVYELYQKHYPRAGRFGGYGCHHFFCACGVGLGGLVNPLTIILSITDMCDYADRHVKLTRTPGVQRYSPEAYNVADPIVKRWGLDGTVTDLTIWEQKGKAAIVEQHFGVEKDCITFCDFVFPLIYSNYSTDSHGDPDAGAKLWSAVTGLDRTEEELMMAYERIWNLERAIACRDGRRREDDWANEWYFTYKDIHGRYLIANDLIKAMDEYYHERGWSAKTGIPTQKTLYALGLQDVADELYRLIENSS